MNIHQFNIFFSWQSDVKENKNIIRKGIKDACQKLKQTNGYEINIDEATRDIPGAPKIEDSIKDKILSCDIFIADITPITQYNGKQYPNSNVIFELGYAMRCMEISRIIIIAKRGSYDANELPFDINHQRLGVFDDRGCNLDFEIEASVKYILDNGKFQYVRFFEDFHLRNNISTRKYLPSVFMEDIVFKEHLRCFVYPSLFYTKLFNETSKMNFDYYNQVFELKEQNHFDFSIASFPQSIKGLSFVDAAKQVDNVIFYLNQKIAELKQRKSNDTNFAKLKIEYAVDGFYYCNKRICLIKGKAGQGKTNLICDLVENVLLKWNIPFVYLNGNEIDANDIGKSIVRALYPEENFTFGDMLRYIQRFCLQQNKPLIIIIEGLNEHEQGELLKIKLQQIIKLLLQYDFVKMIISCRTEYYDNNFSDLLTMFNNHVTEYVCYQHLNKNEEKYLIDNYCDYFSLKANFTEEIVRDFSNNLLLLRIFCETYQKQNIGKIIHLRKDSMFSKYLEHFVSMMPSTKQDVYFIIKTLVKLMLEKNSFLNIPLDDIWEKLSDRQKVVFNQIIDSNILIKRELSQKIFNKEVVGFTFDEFRDYMISHYLVDKIYDANSPESFIEYVTNFTSQEHILKEGLTCFLFCYSKENMPDVLSIFKKQNWYKETFRRYIWEIKEEHIDVDDVELIKRIVLEYPYLVTNLIYYGRLNTNLYKKININLLSDILVRLSDLDLEKFLNSAWPCNNYGLLDRNIRIDFVNSINELLCNKPVFNNECWYNILIPLIFLAPFSWEAEDVLRKFYKEKQNVIPILLQNLKINTKSNKLKELIETL